MRVLPTVFSFSIKIKKGFAVVDVSEVLKAIDHFNFDEWEKIGTGNVAEIQAADELRTELDESLATPEDETRIRL